jgi:hypothetical protein
VSRSRKKTPVHGITTARSDKPYKVDEHRRERSAARRIVKQTADGDDPRLHKVYGDPWGAPKDGKTWAVHRPKSLRK